MKTLKKLVFAFALPLLAGAAMVSCSNDDNDSGNTKPTLVFESGSGLVAVDTAVNPNAQLNFRVIATQNSDTKKKLRNLTVTRVFDNTPTVVLDSNLSESTINIDVAVTANAAAGKENFIFSVTDKDGVTTTKTIIITTIGLEVRNGDINHIAGRCRGAFNLISVVDVASSGSADVKDLINTDQAGEDTFTGSFNATNGTMFRLALGTFNYNTASEASIAQAYNVAAVPGVNPGPSARVSNPAAGNVYLVNLRGTGRFAAIRVIANTPGEDDNCAANDAVAANKGELTFEYKIPTDVVLN